MSTACYVVGTRAVSEALRALDAAIDDARMLSGPGRVYIVAPGTPHAGFNDVVEVEHAHRLYVVYEPEQAGGRPILDDLLARTLAGLRWTRTTQNQVFLDDHDMPSRYVITREDGSVTLTLHSFKDGEVCDPHVTVSAHDRPVVHALFAVAMATGKAEREGAAR